MENELQVGAHLVSPRAGYTHQGVYVGEGKVIHYSGLGNGLESGPVIETDLLKFSGNRTITVKTYTNALPVDVIIRRARSRLGESAYNVFHNNCEHFCLWCIMDEHTSPQIDRVALIGTPSAAACFGVASRGVVATAGSVAGLSGSGIMSGLATSGAVVGGGATAGIALLGAAPGVLVATAINHTVLADNPLLDPDERLSRKVGRAASYVGVGVGTAGSIAAISAAGTTAGLGAAGITSGLAAIGGVVGGGMATGLVVATAIPMAAGAALGYGIYKIARWFWS